MAGMPVERTNYAYQAIVRASYLVGPPLGGSLLELVGLLPLLMGSLSRKLEPNSGWWHSTRGGKGQPTLAKRGTQRWWWKAMYATIRRHEGVSDPSEVINTREHVRLASCNKASLKQGGHLI
jgi:hypothetical protein